MTRLRRTGSLSGDGCTALRRGPATRWKPDTEGRYAARFEGVRRFVQQLDAALMQSPSTEDVGHDYCVLRPGSAHSDYREVQALLRLAEPIVETPIRTVLDKTEIPASGNKNDYFSLPRYAHAIGGKIIHIDGRSAEASIIGSEGSYSYDRTAWHQCFAHASVLAASGVLCQREDFLRRSAEILAAWFIDKDTAMTPSARFAQWRFGHAGKG